MQFTLAEHTAIFTAIEAADVELSERAMHTHISDAWQRRRPPDHLGTKPLRSR
jgi:DNA-binding GntR family transcriptional regulator